MVTQLHWNLWLLSALESRQPKPTDTFETEVQTAAELNGLDVGNTAADVLGRS
jgi:hypothetical protein